MKRVTPLALGVLGLSLALAAPTVTPPRVIALGDSITAANSDEKNGSWGGLSYLTLAAIQSEGSLRYLRNSGIGGQTSQQIADRVDADVLAHKPDVVVVTAGTNDVSQSVALDVTRGNLERIITTLQKANIRVVLGTIPPRNDVKFQPATVAVNAMIKTLGQQYKLTVVDFYGVLVDPATKGYKAGFTQDGVHPLAPASAAMATALLKALKLPAAPIALAAKDSEPTNLLTNALFTQVGGNGAPKGWGAYGSSTFKVTTTKDPAFQTGQTATLQKTAAGGYVVLNVGTGNGFKPGDRIAVAGNLVTDVESGKATWSLRVDFQEGATKSAFLTFNAGSNVKGTFYREFTVPAGTKGVLLNAIINEGTGSMKLNRVTFSKLSK